MGKGVQMGQIFKPLKSPKNVISSTLCCRCRKTHPVGVNNVLFISYSLLESFS